MASQQSTVDFIVDQMADAGSVSGRKMFGEYAIFCDGKMVALVCDDRLYVKPTSGGRGHIGDVIEEPPYKGAKPYLVIAADRLDDADWMSMLVRISAAELPAAAKKRRVK